MLSRSQWPRGVRRRSADARLLRSWVPIQPGSWIFACCDYCVMSGRGLCDELITRPEESYRMWCVVVCDLETSRMRSPDPLGGRSRHRKIMPKVYQTKLLILYPKQNCCVPSCFGLLVAQFGHEISRLFLVF